MKIFKRIVLAFLIVSLAAAIGGFFYFDKKFTPPENYLEVLGIAEDVSINWVSTNDNPYYAFLLPVQIKGIDKQFYMQLDFGSPITIFYDKTLESIQAKFSKQILFNKSSNKIALDFDLQKMRISSANFKLLNYGDKVDFENPNTKNIIGTIGTDLLEKRIIRLDFKNQRCSFLDKMEETGFADFEFKKRRILVPAKIGGKNLKLMYDSGTSGYELITNKRNGENTELKTENGNSWGNSLTVISAPANKQIRFGNTELNLSEVTYIEGTSTIQNLLMKLSGMQGMIGNKIFLNHNVILDCKNQKFKVE